jgi:hypothetical protein
VDVGIFDFEFPSLKGMVRHLDAGIDEWCAACEHCPDPDSFGIYDEIESIVGNGFVVCQTYMLTRVRNRPKRMAYKVGPVHSSKLHIAEIISAGANYWKHHPEWPAPETPTAHGKAAANVLRALDLLGDGYIMTNLLHTLVDPAPLRISSLLPHLTSWRDALDPGASAWWP